MCIIGRWLGGKHAVDIKVYYSDAGLGQGDVSEYKAVLA